MSVLFISYHNSRNTLFFFSRLAGSRLHPGVASGWAQFCSTAGTLRRRGSFQFSHRNYPQYIKAIAKLRRGRFWGMGIRGTLEEQRGGGGGGNVFMITIIQVELASPSDHSRCVRIFSADGPVSAPVPSTTMKSSLPSRDGIELAEPDRNQ